MNRYLMYMCFVALLMLFACTHKKDCLDTALRLSGVNRHELERVLLHYKDDPERKAAAEFLIGNLIGNVSYDTTLLCKYRPVLLRYDSLKKVENEQNINAKDTLNWEWKKFLRNNDPHKDIYSKFIYDINVISADYLIENIDQAFLSWEQSLYKDSVLWDDFLKYVLPYRKNNGYVIERWRDYFLSRYGDYMQRYSSPRQLVDSLLEQFNDYQVDWTDITTYPYVCLQDYNLSRISRCPDRCWFNAMLFSALGIPCTIDFVPAWGNRNSCHEWNAIVINGKTYPFESTGGKGKWKAGKVYNNVWVDEYWMKSRLPKVFRYSYETIRQGPNEKKNGSSEGIYPYFQNTKYEDVSDEYFMTSDICIPIQPERKADGADYAYLCVFNEDMWKPVFWGKVRKNNVVSQKMGRDIVYLPVFYKNGNLVPFNDPFILRADGNIHFLRTDKDKAVAVTLERKYYARPDIGLWCKWNEGARFDISDHRDFSMFQTVFSVPECKSHPNVWQLDTLCRCRYIRYVFPEDKNVLAELNFYERTDSGALKPLSGVPFSSDKEQMSTLNNLFDGDILTFADLNPFLSSADTVSWVGVDFGKEVEISALGICPRNDKNDVIKDMEYELYYWNNSWKSLGKKKALDYMIQYDGVPSDALLLLKCTTEGRENRIFTYEDGKQIWW